MHYIIIHIGNNNPVGFMKFIEVLGKLSGKKGNKESFAMQPGNIPETDTDVDDLAMTVEFKPAHELKKKVRNLWSGIFGIDKIDILNVNKFAKVALANHARRIYVDANIFRHNK